ncbi:carboxypeptidase-like regulatory domain-containing protein, partial [Flavobacteriales bacterium]|nr:carboxypeptidase-like regulatory domain-containing protein [Flavobacteriales bacterium]
MKYIVLIALQISTLFIYAQGNINGKINDQNGLPLIGANIVVENTTIGTTSDVNGKFKLEVDKLPVNIKVTYIGFQPKT